MTKRRSELPNLTVQQHPSTEEYNLTRTKHRRKIYLFRFPRLTAMDLVHTCLFVHNPFVFHTAYCTKLHHVIFSMSISGSIVICSRYIREWLVGDVIVGIDLVEALNGMVDWPFFELVPAVEVAKEGGGGSLRAGES